MRLGAWSISFCLLAAISGCERSGKLRVADVTQSQSFPVKARSSSPTGITLHVKGHLDGTAFVYIQSHAKESLSGDVDWKVYHDWFEQECEISFEPGSAASGSLEISYVFD
jgi:hypothetical protein